MNLPHRCTVQHLAYRQRLSFIAGSAAVAVGATIVGAPSEAQGRVAGVSVDDGEWAGGTAAGTIVFDPTVGTFELNDVLSTLPAGGAATVSAAPEDDEGTLGSNHEVWTDYLVNLRCRFYQAKANAATLDTTGESVRHVPMVMLEAPIEAQEVRIVTTTPGWVGTYEIASVSPRGGAGAAVHHYEAELRGVVTDD